MTLLVLAIPLAYAAPAFALQSRAEYDLTGYVQAEQTCTADPPEFTDRACGFAPPPPPPPPPVQVSIYDNGTSVQCSADNVGSCGFSPQSVSAPVGGLVIWTNNGQLQHTVTTDTGPFGSPLLSPGDNFGASVGAPGNYAYHCSIHSWMTGSVFFFSRSSSVTPGVVISPTTFRVDFDGTVDWAVEALSSETVVLDVNHEVAVSVSPIPGVTFTPFSEEGSFEEVINLRERTVSSGTATGIVAAILEAFQRAYSGFYSPVAVSTYGHDEHYTIWFVNGPLALGSPVEVLIGTGSVTGEETVTIADVGPRSAWKVTSDFSQSFTVNSPPPGSFTSTVDADLGLTWSYDKRGDLLLRSEARVDAMSHTESQTTVFVDNPCAPSGWCPIYREVKVTRETNFTIVLALQLTSTNINLDRENRQKTTLGLLSDMISDGLWLPLSAGGVAVGAIAAAGKWFVWRKHRHNASPGTESPGVPTAPPSLPA